MELRGVKRQTVGNKSVYLIRSNYRTSIHSKWRIQHMRVFSIVEKNTLIRRNIRPIWKLYTSWWIYLRTKKYAIELNTLVNDGH